MPETVSIKRRKSTDNDTSFDSLRSEAIKLIQEISGKTWTDYNLHDPGITILEQLIYSVTDLIYRTEFAIEDYLAGEDGSIDFELQALHSPVEIFPCRPTTELDYRKLFLNEISEIDNVWLKPMLNSESCRGIYQLSVKLAHGLNDSAQEKAIEKIKASYHRNRSLCEDICEPILLKNIEYELYANIEVSSSRSPLEVMAEIYFECAQSLGSSVSITNYDELDDDAISLEELFTGPYTCHGFFSDSDMCEQQTKFTVSTLFSVINSIDSVSYIKQLCLKNGDTSIDDIIEFDDPNIAFSLLTPRVAKDVNVVLTKNGRELNVSFEELRAKIDEINFKYYTSRSTTQNLSLLYDTVKGRSGQPEKYFSIQNQFPSNFGIGAAGLPGSADTDTKAKARQLKAYLVIFEQFLVNFLANIDSIKTLFSVETQTLISYSSKSLDAQEINDLNAVYPEQAAKVFTPIIAKFDHYLDRKSRLLDYLLALYGESFTQSSLRNFNYYYNKDEVESVIVKNKAAYLENMVELGRDRAAGCNYTAWVRRERTHSGLLLRVGMLLGFEQPAIESLTKDLRRQDIRLYKHGDDGQLEGPDQKLALIKFDEMDESFDRDFQALPFQAPPKDLSLKELREKFDESILFQNGQLNDQFFREGVYLDRYRVGKSASQRDYQILFLFDDSQYVDLGSYEDKVAATEAAYHLRQYLLLLNRHSEGLHVIEHILLRREGNVIGETSFLAGTVNGTYGDLTIDTAGNWSYSADNTQSAIQQLDLGESITDTLMVTSFDGTTHNVVITLNGSDDAAIIGGTTTGTVTEDGTLTSSGVLTITDTDLSDATNFVDVATSVSDNGYGTFKMTANNWTFVLDNTHASVQALDVGESITDTYTFAAPDCVTQLVTVTINGAEDTPLFDSTAITTATEDCLYSYTISTSDVDIEAVPITTLPAWLSLVDNGNGTATLSGTPINANVGNHNVVLNVSDSSVSSNQNFTITVGNTNDAALIAGIDTGAVTEEVGVIANNISTSGLLTITDAEGFFPFKISVIFPAWTTRCFDKQFRKLAQETVQLNAPAQIYPVFYWLDIDRMTRFESLYETWLKLKSNQQSDRVDVDASAQDLKVFLLKYRSESGGSDEPISNE